MPYRDELEALKHRELQLAVELEETRRLRSAAEKRALPVLDSLRVASPCPAKWDDMIGDERVRFCGACAKNVYDLSAMTRAEAEGFLSSQVGAVCVSFRRRTDGKILTSDCPVGVRRRRFGIGVIAFAAAAAAAAASASVLSFSPCPPQDPPARARPSAKTLDGTPKTTGQTVRTNVTTGVTMPLVHDRGTRTTGCACQPGDPLCSCL